MAFSKLDAVNQILAAATGLLPVSALDSSGTFPNLSYGTSDAAQAERILDRVSRRVQEAGWDENTERGKLITAAGAPLEIVFGTTVGAPANPLKIIPVGQSAYRQFVLRNNKVYDKVLSSTTFASAETICLDVVVWLDYLDCQPGLRERILSDAIVEFNMQRRQNVLIDQHYRGVNQTNEIRAARNPVERGDVPRNPTPFPIANPFQGMERDQ